MATILLASAQAQDRRHIAEVLKKDGHDCIECAHGDSVREVLEARLPDLVITNVDLPGLDAFALVRLLEKLSNGGSVPLLVGHSGSPEYEGESQGPHFAWMGLSSSSEGLLTMVRARLASGPIAQGKLLVIEDDFDLRSLLARRLQMAGYAVVTAQDGEEGLTCLDDGPDLVLTDVDMPRLDGFGFLMRMRAIPQYRSLPVIVMTAQAGRAEDAARGLELGANDYVRKPFDWRELLARVETQLRVREAYRLAAEKQRDLAIIELAGAAAHEINNPLAVLLARLELMREHIGESGDYYGDVVKLEALVARIASIVQKLSHVRRYQVQHYCGGANILDLNSAAEE